MKIDVNRSVLNMHLLALLMGLCKETLAKDPTLDDDISKGFLETNRAPALNHLSRKRRYLEFPEGSSIQMVYDLVVGVVDYSNYITVSITMALAYHLPSQAPSELLEDLKDRLRDGSFGISRNDTTTNIKYVDVNAEPMRYDAHPKIPRYPQKPTFVEYYTHPAPKRDYYYTPNFNPLQRYFKNPQHLRYTAAKAGKSPWSSPALRTRDPYSDVNRKIDGIKLPSLLRNVPKHHRIYPILGKRIGSNALAGARNGTGNYIPSKLDRIHIRHQRSTRHNLYKAIETYLDSVFMIFLIGTC